MVETAAAWDVVGGGTATSARRRLEQAGFDPTLSDDLEPLLGAGRAATAQVRLAQYGGILADSASVLVVVDQWRLDRREQVRAGGTTLDVRLRAEEPQWTVTEVRPARPGRPAGDLSRPARLLLEDERVRLPHAAVSDVRAGVIDDAVLVALASLAAEHRLDVSVLRSGHPLRVFGTDRISNHTEGRAVDIWALDGRPIIDSGGSRTVTDFMRAASEAGAYQVGGPTDLDGAEPTYFADDTHQDHVHLGFSA